MAQHEGLWIAERDGAPVGALIVGARPAHVHPIGARELYVELLISSRAHARNDIGGHLVRRADALAAEAGVPVRASIAGRGRRRSSAGTSGEGFIRAGMFDYHGWMGQVFEKAIPAGRGPGGS